MFLLNILYIDWLNFFFQQTNRCYVSVLVVSSSYLNGGKEMTSHPVKYSIQVVYTNMYIK